MESWLIWKLAFLQTWKQSFGAENNSSDDEGPDDGAESGSGAGSDAEKASGDDVCSDDQQHQSS